MKTFLLIFAILYKWLSAAPIMPVDHHSSLTAGARMDSWYKVADKIQFANGAIESLMNHDATKDNQRALKSWFKMPQSLEKLEILSFLVQNPTVNFNLGKQRVLKEVVEMGDLNLSKILLDRGCIIDEDVLIHAAYGGDVPMIRFLLYKLTDEGRKISIDTFSDMLYAAAETSNSDLATFLLSLNPNIPLERSARVAKFSSDESFVRKMSDFW